MIEIERFTGSLLVSEMLSTWLTDKWDQEVADSIFRSMLECPVRYKPSKDERLRSQLVPKEGALSHVEGLVLYALVRAINAKDILELGTFAGHSTNYLVEAAEQTGGHVVSVDLVRYWGRVWRTQAWSWLSHMRAVFVKSDARKHLEGVDDNSLDFILEDTDHGWLNTIKIIELSKDKLRSGGILAIHDVAVAKGVAAPPPESTLHPALFWLKRVLRGVGMLRNDLCFDGCDVQGAVEDSGLPFLCFTVYPGTQGLALWRKP